MRSILNRGLVLGLAITGASSTASAAFIFPAITPAPTNVNRTYQATNLLALPGVGTIPDATYTKGTITLNWTTTGETTPATSSSNAWSSEARATLSSTAGSGTATSSTSLPTYGSGNVVYAGTSLLTPTGGTSSAVNSALTFTFTLANPYVVSGGVAPPLFVNFRQAFTPFSTQVITYNNTVVTLDTASAPTATAFGAVPGTASAARASTQVLWWTVVIPTAGTYVFDTLGSTLTASTFGDLNDTELGLYSSTGTLLANNDDDGSLNTSKITQALTPGTYYVAASAYDTTFAGSWGVTSVGTQTGAIKLNIAPLPEPASLAAVGIAGLMTLARRRR
jgi:hypothetical protein